MLFWDQPSQVSLIETRLQARFQRVFAHGAFIMGSEVQELEQELSRLSGAPHVVSCASGSDALWLALQAHGIGPGDAVFVPTFSFVASAGAVVRAGATPVFVDCERGSFCIGSESLASAIDSFVHRPTSDSRGSLRPAAVIGVDLFGMPCNYPALQAVADRYAMLVISDAAQSLGATRGGRSVGSLTGCSATSFFPTKPLGCFGDGGAIFCEDVEISTKLMALRNHGRRDGWVSDLGCNSRLDTLQAAVLLEKLTIFDEERRRRTEIASFYSESLIGLVDLPSVETGTTSAWSQFPVVLKGPAKEFPSLRDRVLGSLAQAGVPTRIYYERPIHREPAYERWLSSSDELCRAEELSDRVLSLPIHPYLSETELTHVVETMKKAVL